MIQIKQEPLVGIQELSEQLNMNRYTIYKKIRENRFPKGIKLNGRRMFKVNQITEYFNTIGVQVIISES